MPLPFVARRSRTSKHVSTIQRRGRWWISCAMRLEWICGCTVHGQLSWHQEKKDDGKKESGRSALLGVVGACHRPRELGSANMLMLHGFDFGVVITYRRVVTPTFCLTSTFWLLFVWPLPFDYFFLTSTFWPTWHGWPFWERVGPARTALEVTETRKLPHHDKVAVHIERKSVT